MDCESHKVLGNVELLQVIFSKIPLPELLKSTASVCQLWNRVIHCEETNFLPLKKSFYKVVNQSEDEIEKICHNLQNDLSLWNPGYPIGQTDAYHDGRLGNLERSLPYLLKKFSCHPKIALLNLPHDCLKLVNKHKR